jgi:hypothetical protein
VHPVDFDGTIRLLAGNNKTRFLSVQNQTALGEYRLSQDTSDQAAEIQLISRRNGTMVPAKLVVEIF